MRKLFKPVGCASVATRNRRAAATHLYKNCYTWLTNLESKNVNTFKMDKDNRFGIFVHKHFKVCGGLETNENSGTPPVLVLRLRRILCSIVSVML